MKKWVSILLTVMMLVNSLLTPVVALAEESPVSAGYARVEREASVYDYVDRGDGEVKWTNIGTIGAEGYVLVTDVMANADGWLTSMVYAVDGSIRNGYMYAANLAPADNGGGIDANYNGYDLGNVVFTARDYKVSAPTEAPAEEPQEEAAPAEDEEVEAPAEDEPPAEDEEVEVPAEDETPAEDEEVEAPAEDETPAEDEEVEAPAEDENVEAEEGDVEEEEVVEEEVVEEEPITSLSAVYNGTMVTLTAEPGVIPAGAELQVESVADESVRAAVEAAMQAQDMELVTFAAYDITLLVDGKVVQPSSDVKVAINNAVSSISTFSAADNDDTKTFVYHLNGGSAELVATMEKVSTSPVFTVPHFSVYIVAVGTPKPPYEDQKVIKGKYEAQNGNGKLHATTKDGKDIDIDMDSAAFDFHIFTEHLDAGEQHTNGNIAADHVENVGNFGAQEHDSQGWYEDNYIGSGKFGHNDVEGKLVVGSDVDYEEDGSSKANIYREHGSAHREDLCYDQDGKLICGVHVHSEGEGCYDPDGTLTCKKDAANDDKWLNIKSELDKLSETSKLLGSLADTDNTYISANTASADDWKVDIDVSRGGDVVVINLDAMAYSSNGGQRKVLFNIKGATNKTVIVNVDLSNVPDDQLSTVMSNWTSTINGIGHTQDNSYTDCSVLWNFIRNGDPLKNVGDEAINIGGANPFCGTILMPDANIEYGQVNGSVIARRATNKGGESHTWYFTTGTSVEVNKRVVDPTGEFAKNYPNGYTFFFYIADETGKQLTDVSMMRWPSEQTIYIKVPNYNANKTYKVVEVQATATGNEGGTGNTSTWNPTGFEFIVSGNGNFTGDSPSVTITNTYKTQTFPTFEPKVEKTVTGNPSTAEKFTFLIEWDEASSTGKKCDPTSLTTTITGAGSETFGVFGFGEDGTYVFNISEIPGDNEAYEYDSSKQTVTVTVKDGKIESTVYSSNGNAASFTNTFKGGKTSVVPRVEKSIVSSQQDVPSETFEFTIEGADDASKAVLEGLNTTVTITNTGKASFPKLTFTAPGTYKFYIKEVDGSEKGWGYDDSTWTYIVTVNDDMSLADAHYEKKGVSNGKVASFVNFYYKSVNLPISVVKKFRNEDNSWNDNEVPEFALEDTFTFVLTQKDTDAMKAIAGVPQTLTLTGAQIKNAGQEGVKFAKELSFAADGVYHFVLTEQVNGKYNRGVISWNITVEVNNGASSAQIQDKSLDGTVSADGNNGKFEFVNIYNLEKGGLTVSKTVENGSAMKEFTFTVTTEPAVNGTFGEMEFENGKATFTLKDGGSVTASGLPAGTKFTVTESDNDGYELSWSGDVSEDGKGTIEAQKTVEANAKNIGTGSKEISVTVKKKWVHTGNDNPTEPDITVQLVKDGNVEDSATLNADNGWSHTFEGLDPDATYTVVESNVPENYEPTSDKPVVDEDGNITITITNKYKDEGEPEKISVKVVKEWIGDTEAVRPKSITINLMKDGEIAETITLPQDGKWEYTWTGLEKGNYTVKEVEVEGYTSNVGEIKDGVITVTNTKKEETPTKISVKVVKKWVGDTEEDRPESITINLMKDGEIAGTITLPQDGKWEYTWKDLEKGNYTVEEVEVEGYTSNVGEIKDGVITVTNTKDEEEPAPQDVSLELKVLKKLVGGNFEDLPSDLSFTLEIVAANDGISRNAITAFASSGVTIGRNDYKGKAEATKSFGTFKFTDAYLTEENTAYHYTITIKESGTGSDGWTYDNTVWTLNVTVDKCDGKLDVHVIGADLDNGVVTVSFTNEHEEEEETPGPNESETPTPETTTPGVETTTPGVTETPGPETTTPGVETTTPGVETTEPSEETTTPGVETTEPSEETTTPDVETTEPAEETTTPDVETTEPVEETEEPAETPAPAVQLTNLIGTKTWVDNDDADGMRPENIEIILYANGNAQNAVPTWVKNGNVWTYTFRNLPVANAAGVPIIYTVSETPVEYYTTAQDGLNFTNTIVPKEEVAQISVSGQKTWQDNDNASNKRPESITIELRQNGVAIRTATVTANDNWAYTFTDLPEGDGYGNAYTYTVSEQAVPGYYAVYDGMNVTNVLMPKVPDLFTINDMPVARGLPGFGGYNEGELMEMFMLFDYGVPLFGVLLGTGLEIPMYPFVFAGFGALAIVLLLAFGRKKKEN